jgi:hypothetical protein
MVVMFAVEEERDGFTIAEFVIGMLIPNVSVLFREVEMKGRERENGDKISVSDENIIAVATQMRYKYFVYTIYSII